jgi:hypothetical protein
MEEPRCIREFEGESTHMIDALGAVEPEPGPDKAERSCRTLINSNSSSMHELTSFQSQWANGTRDNLRLFLSRGMYHSYIVTWHSHRPES